MKTWLFAFALVFLATAASATQSTINPLLPTANSPLTSAPVRSNFTSAYNDINNLYTLVGTGGGGGGGNLSLISTTSSNTYYLLFAPGTSGNATSLYLTPNISITANNGLLTASSFNTVAISGTYNIGGNPILSLPHGDFSSVAVGQFAGSSQVRTNAQNTAVGEASLQLNTSGVNNTAIGYGAGANIVTGSDNTAVGHEALNAAAGTWNTAIGRLALAFATGNSNTGVGHQALGALTTGTNNATLGFNSGITITSGGSNLVLGTSVGSTKISTGSGNVLIGDSNAIDVSTTGAANEIHIGGFFGDWAFVSGTNTPASETTTIYGTVNLPTALPISSGGTGISTTPTNGQILIGGASGYTPAVITPGSNISVTNGNGSIIIAATTTASSSVSLSSITSGTGANSIDNTSNAQTWAWTGLTTGTALTLSSSTITTGSLLALTATAGSAGKTLNVTGNAAISGTTTLATAQIGAGNAIFTTATATNALVTTITAATANIANEAISGTSTIATAQIGAGNAIFTTATATNFEGINALVTTLTATTANFTSEALSGTATLATAQIGAGNAIFTTTTATNFEGTNALVTTLTGNTGHFTNEAISGTSTIATAQIGAGNAILTTLTASAVNSSNAVLGGTTTTSAMEVTGNLAMVGASAQGAQSTPAISTATFTPNATVAQSFDIVLVHAACPCTIANPTNIASAVGQTGVLEIDQSATGSDTVGTWGTDYKFAAATPPTLSTGANAADFFSYYVKDSTHIIISGGILNAH